ncbi:MFS transporter [Variovorax sp. M-6]|uniref:MFS transporter n=1 Tax=Variovorax sp. M-6 TaxID=3233041 RepID=UPI003F9E982C
MSHHVATPHRATSSPAKVAGASLIGTSLEFYDHFIYGTAAALVFPKLFFSQEDPRIALLLSLMSYGLAFAARPIGAALFGHFGDRVGRKRILFITLLMMGLSTFLIGMLPTYASVGILAPALLAVLRLTQGLALGGEWGGAALMVNESGGKAKGFLGSLVQVASPIGFLLANLAFAGVTAAVSEEAFMSWGWRLPFFASAALVVTGLYIRMSLTESPEFEKMQASHGAPRQAPIVEVFSRHYGKLAIAVGARAGSDIAWYVFSLFLQVYLVRIGVSRSVALQAGMLAAVTQVFAIPFFGYLADRWGSRTVLALGAVAGMGWAFVFFRMVDTGIPAQIIAACMVGMFIQAALWAPLASFLPEMFPTHVRFTGAGLGFQLAGIAGGAFAPLIAIALLNQYESSLPIAVYVAGSLVFVLVAIACAGRPSVRPELALSR